jgi:fumarate reductase flavoprotein subunit
METISTDVVIIGAGGAGLRAAIALAEAEPTLRIALISKVYPMRSHTCAAEGGAAGVIKADDSFDLHFDDTVGGGDWLSDQDCVEYFIHEAPKELLQLEHWGCPWNREADGSVAVRPFGGMKKKRTWFAADKSGFHILHTLFQTSLQFPSIKRYDEYYALDLLVDDGRCQGVTALEMRSGELRQFHAKAVIIAGGGAGRMFPFSTNGAIKTGDGMAMAYRAGAPLKDMEFVQYHPTGLPNTGSLLTEACRGEGGILVNKHGRRYLQDYGMGPETPVGQPQLKTMELGPRDRVSQAYWHELQKGNTVTTQWGECVLLDMRHLGEKKINERLPLVRELAESLPRCRYRQGRGSDPPRGALHDGRHLDQYEGRHGPCPDSSPQASVPASASTAPIASVRIRWWNCWCSAAARRCRPSSTSRALPASKRGRALMRLRRTDAVKRIDELMTRTDGTESMSALRREMMDTMEKNVGIYRTEEGLQEGVNKIHELRQRYQPGQAHRQEQRLQYRPVPGA